MYSFLRFSNEFFSIPAVLYVSVSLSLADVPASQPANRLDILFMVTARSNQCTARFIDTASSIVCESMKCECECECKFVNLNAFLVMRAITQGVCLHATDVYIEWHFPELSLSLNRRTNTPHSDCCCCWCDSTVMVTYVCVCVEELSCSLLFTIRLTVCPCSEFKYMNKQRCVP